VANGEWCNDVSGISAAQLNATTQEMPALPDVIIDDVGFEDEWTVKMSEAELAPLKFRCRLENKR
jgi:hypothetical protein